MSYPRVEILLLLFCVLLTPIVKAGGSADEGTPSEPKRKVVEVPVKTLDSYVGQYEFAPNDILTFYRDCGHLLAKFTNGDAREVFPASPVRFFCTST